MQTAECPNSRKTQRSRYRRSQSLKECLLVLSLSSAPSLGVEEGTRRNNVNPDHDLFTFKLEVVADTRILPPVHKRLEMEGLCEQHALGDLSNLLGLEECHHQWRVLSVIEAMTYPFSNKDGVAGSLRSHVVLSSRNHLDLSILPVFSHSRAVPESACVQLSRDVVSTPVAAETAAALGQPGDSTLAQRKVGATPSDKCKAKPSRAKPSCLGPLQPSIKSFFDGGLPPWIRSMGPPRGMTGSNARPRSLNLTSGIRSEAMLTSESSEEISDGRQIDCQPLARSHPRNIPSFRRWLNKDLQSRRNLTCILQSPSRWSLPRSSVSRKRRM